MKQEPVPVVPEVDGILKVEKKRLRRLLKGYGRFVHTFLCLNGGGIRAMNKEEL